jgi:hypothetical protein
MPTACGKTTHLMTGQRERERERERIEEKRRGEGRGEEGRRESGQDFIIPFKSTYPII